MHTLPNTRILTMLAVGPQGIKMSVYTGLSHTIQGGARREDVLYIFLVCGTLPKTKRDLWGETAHGILVQLNTTLY